MHEHDSAGREPAAMTAGVPAPLGAQCTAAGVNFAVRAPRADGVDLCLFEPVTGREQARYRLPARTAGVWHGFLPAPVAGPGTLYGFRAHGPFEPRAGQRFNPAKLLIDPCARDLAGALLPSPAVADDPESGPREEDSAPWMPRGRIIDPRFDWQETRAPAVPWRDTLIYELHVKGFTQQHPAVPPEWRGKYLGLTVPAVISHLRALGVTTLELMPCQAFASEPFLLERGLVNYWGYNPLAWFAPEPRYAVADPVREFRTMVRELHAAGIEVILDVVFNHTAEGGAGGRTLSFKGLDNAGYYRLAADDGTRYEDFTGCGNTVAVDRPAVRELVLDCLRYWAGEMRVDGFRFDLATVMGRGPAGFDPHAALFGAIRSDPQLAYCKLVAEPWDLGPGGYQLGGFPAGWAEWNDRYRDTVRAFWRGDAGRVPELAERLAGSSDLFRTGGRRPQASVNFVTSHDGFTLADLVSYRERHNEANLENNGDGHRESLSCNHGVEGPSDDPQVVATRRRHRCNLLATLLLSQGVPMLRAGDEFGQSQAGNNNAYCQDNVTSWLAWPGAGDDTLVGLIGGLGALRRRRPELTRDTFFKGSPREGRQPDVRWLHADGRDMASGDWTDGELRQLGMLLGAEAGAGDLLLLTSAAAADLWFRMPPDLAGTWRLLLDTAAPAGAALPASADPPFRLRAGSLLLMERVT